MNRINKFTTQDKNDLLSKTFYALPDNPSTKNFSPSQIKKKGYEGYLVLIDFINKVIDELNENVDLSNGAISEVQSYFSSGKALKAIGDEDGNSIKSTYFSGVTQIAGSKSSTFQKNYYRFVNQLNEQIGLITVNLDLATSEYAGLLSASDKSKIDAIASDIATSLASAKSYADSKVARSNLVSVLGEASTSLNGLMSSQDKTNLDTLMAILGSSQGDTDAFVNTIREILAIFENYPEGASVIGALALKANSADVYTKSETDDLLALKANSSSVYVKSDVDDLLALKANSSSVYTKTETDNLLNAKEDKSNKVTSIDNLSTDTQYPSAKAVYTLVGTELGSYYTKSETNTLLSAKQDTLTFDNVPTANSNNPVKSGGVYSSIRNVREVAEGKCKTIIISYNATPVNQNTYDHYTKADGTGFNDYQDFEEYTNQYSCGNSAFNSQDNNINTYDKYLITTDETIIVPETDVMRSGDIILVIETDVPDRWLDWGNDTAYKLETSKIDLTDYVDYDNLNTILENFSGYSVYSSSSTYNVGDIVLNEESSSLYRCNTQISVAEEWTPAHWTSISIADLLDEKASLSGNNTFTGTNTFTDTLKVKNALYNPNLELNVGNYSWNITYYGTDYLSGDQNLLRARTLIPKSTNFYDLGSSSYKWRNLILSGDISDGTNAVSVSNIAKKGLIGDEYDSTSTYAVGDLVIYNNTLYKCSTAITTAEEWDSSHWTATKLTSELGGGNFGFPIITAPSSTTLTNDEVSTISSGAIVLSSFLGFEKCVFFPIGIESFGEKAGMVVGVNGFTPEIRAYKISSQNVISLYNDDAGRTRLSSIARFNGKNVPAYPSSTGTFVLKCVNGTLTWVAE